MIARVGRLMALLLIITFPSAFGQSNEKRLCFEFYEGTFNSEVSSAFLPEVPQVLSQQTVKQFYNTANASTYQPLVDSLLAFKKRYKLNDWIYYQLVRKTAQQLSPKADNYGRYTLYKWFLMAKSGYDARLALTQDKVIFYVYNREDVENLPFFIVDGRKYVCLNWHDYARANLNDDPAKPVTVDIPDANRPFSYKIDKMPELRPSDYFDKELQFTYKHKAYYFNVKLSKQVDAIFNNYPVVDFASYFNIPLTKETYGSLIPTLKENVKKMSQKKGIDYLMRFTRYAFLYENDEENFGFEKRLSPEETLFSKYSDCDDRAALFFYLVKEIYNLPMIALLYPTHITIGVQFDKPVGTPVMYKGIAYSVCEPTPQKEDLGIGQLSSALKNAPYQVVYQYEPGKSGM
ncbi:hypothetical protein [Mucilaginibacter auburnensis]|uniref:Transglutaminase superfamily protein n=1 Tax=Mucilaginibacter auburnensis TaxID=1457233 RepID=A0A2H9VQQ1_9SPHI|nr:hypothetical protein [Mucilaginibacter auburnensis]PJJ83140.1 hypothetical protein CLV57_0118 [Mucilaginibacter auburnensis]